jgi:hypothetical protein
MTDSDSDQRRTVECAFVALASAIRTESWGEVETSADRIADAARTLDEEEST